MPIIKLLPVYVQFFKSLLTQILICYTITKMSFEVKQKKENAVVETDAYRI